MSLRIRRPHGQGGSSWRPADLKRRLDIRDRDAIYGEKFRRHGAALHIKEIRIAQRSPWQNPYAERVIGSIRRECLDHLIVLSERHLRRILSSYADYSTGRGRICPYIRTRLTGERRSCRSRAE
jgi:hypothetical protein